MQGAAGILGAFGLAAALLVGSGSCRRVDDAASSTSRVTELSRARAALVLTSERTAPPDAREDLLATLRARVHHGSARAASPRRQQQTARVYGALTAALRTHPATLHEVTREVIADRPIAVTLIDALREAGTPGAQRALQLLLARPELARARRARIARALSLVASPTAETIETLRALEADRELRALAHLGLGTAAYRLRDSDPARAAAILDHLLNRLARASSVGRGLEDEIALLRALGDAGHPGSLDVLAAHLADPRERIRVAAAHALHKVPGARADDLIAQASQDRSASVRAAAVEALPSRPPSLRLATTIARRLGGESDPIARARVVHVAVRWLPHAPSVLEGPLRQVADRDPRPELRRMARAALER